MLVKELYRRLNNIRAGKDMPPVPEELYLTLIAKMAIEGSIELDNKNSEVTRNPSRQDT